MYYQFSKKIKSTLNQGNKVEIKQFNIFALQTKDFEFRS